MISANEIAQAFNQQNARKSWSARPNNTLVHFNPSNGLTSLIYDASTARWQVKYSKYQAAWGDYVKSAARMFHAVLTTLKSAGLPFDAPEDIEGIEIVTLVDGENIYIRYVPPAPLTLGDVLKRDDPLMSMPTPIPQLIGGGDDPAAEAIMEEIRTDETVEAVKAADPTTD